MYGRVNVHGFRKVRTSYLLPICNDTAYTYTAEFRSVDDPDDSSVVLRMSDAIDHGDPAAPAGRITADAIKTSDIATFEGSVCAALGCHKVERWQSGKVYDTLFSPTHISMEECTALRDHDAVIEVTLVPIGIIVRFSDIDNSINNLQRSKRKTPERFRPVTAKPGWTAKPPYRAPACKRSAAPTNPRRRSKSTWDRVAQLVFSGGGGTGTKA